MIYYNFDLDFAQFGEIDDAKPQRAPTQKHNEPISWSRLYRWLSGKSVTAADSAAVTLGNAIHCRYLTPKIYADTVVVFDAPINPATGAEYGAGTKKVADARAAAEAANPCKLIVTRETANVVENVARQIVANGFNVPDSAAIETMVERVVIVGDTEVTLHGRPDYFEWGRVVDLKTTATPIATFDGRDQFYWTARKLGYLHQLAFYALILDYPDTECRLIVAETVEPFRVSKITLNPKTLKMLQNDILDVFLPAYIGEKPLALNFEY